jgi:hypothetical protein
MLIKLTPGVNFTNILRAGFTCLNPKSAKDDLTVIFALLGSGLVKAVLKMLVKLTLGYKTLLLYIEKNKNVK